MKLPTQWYKIQGNVELQQIMLAQFALAIARFEGFFIPNSISQRNLNPGNLRPIGASTGFRRFETAEDGWEALKRQIMININRGLTLREFFLGKPGVYPGYAPLGDNPAATMENYITFVAKSVQIPQNVNLELFFPDLINDVVQSPYSWGFDA